MPYVEVRRKTNTCQESLTYMSGTLYVILLYLPNSQREVLSSLYTNKEMKE